MPESKANKLSLSMSKEPQNSQRPQISQRSLTDTTASSTTSSRKPSMATAPALCRLPQLNVYGYPVDVLARNYPRPTSEVNVEASLQQPAQPGTFRYQLENGKETNARVMTEEDKKAEFERVKKALKGWATK